MTRRAQRWFTPICLWAILGTLDAGTEHAEAIPDASGALLAYHWFMMPLCFLLTVIFITILADCARQWWRSQP